MVWTTWFDERPLVTSRNQCSYVPGTSVVTAEETLPDVSAVNVIVGMTIAEPPGAGVKVVCSSTTPLGVMPVPDSVNTFGAISPAGVIESCGLTDAPVPVSANGCDVPLALIVNVAVRAPSAFGLNFVLTLHVDDAGSEPPSWHVVVNGN